MPVVAAIFLLPDEDKAGYKAAYDDFFKYSEYLRGLKATTTEEETVENAKGGILALSKLIELAEKANDIEFNFYSDTPEHLEQGALVQIERAVNYLTFEVERPSENFILPYNEDEAQNVTDLEEKVRSCTRRYIEALSNHPSHQERIFKQIKEAVKPYPRSFVGISSSPRTKNAYDLSSLFTSKALLKSTAHGNLYDLSLVQVFSEDEQIEEEAEEPQKKKATQKPKGKAAKKKPEKAKGTDARRTPTAMKFTPSSALIYDMTAVLLAGENVGELEIKGKAARKNKQITVRDEGKHSVIKFTTPDSNFEIKIDLSNVAGKHDSSTRKWFTYLLAETAEKCLDSSNVVKNTFTIYFKDLVDIGMYESNQTASRGAFRAFPKLYSITAQGYLAQRAGNKKVRKEQQSFSGLFYNMEKVRGGVEITINEKFEWGLIASSYQKLPTLYYSLPGNAADLFYYIFYLARQKRNELTEGNSFIISYRSIQEFLQLANELNATNVSTQIKAPIEDAIGTILDDAPAGLLNLEMNHAEYCDITEYLEEGFLKVTLKGKWLEEIREYFSKVNKRIETNKKKQEKRIHEAAVKALEKKMKEDDNFLEKILPQDEISSKKVD